MLKKRVDDTSEKMATTETGGRLDGNIGTAPPSVTVSEKTMIGENISIKGSIHGKGDLVIQGTIKGNIDLDKHHLTVGANGNVEAEINAANVTISGRLTGNINAQGRVAITKTAMFNGEIKAKRISVEDGAFLKATIELQPEPKHGDMRPSSPKPPETASSQAIPLTKPAQEKEKSA